MIGHNKLLDSKVHFCCSPDHSETDSLTSLVVTRHALRLIQLAKLPESETAMVSDLQSYLWCRRVDCSVPRRLSRRWDSFYKQYKNLVWQIVVQSSSRLRFSSEVEDIFQEVWHEIVVQLPKLVYDPVRGRLSSWLAGLVRQKVRRLISGQIPHWTQCSIETFDVSLPSPELGPEDSCLMQEMQDQLDDALARFRRKVSPKNFDLFFSRFFLEQSFKEIAAMSGLNTKAVRRRYDRILEKWRGLTREIPMFNCEDELGSASHPPRQMTLS